MRAGKFRSKFFSLEMIGFAFGVPMAVALVLILISLPREQVFQVMVMAFVATILIVGFVAFPLNVILTAQVSRGLNRLASGELTPDECPRLFLLLSKLPTKHALLLLGRMGLGILVVVLLMFFKLKIDGLKCLIAFVLAFYGDYMASMVLYVTTGNLVRPILEQIVASKMLQDSFITGKKCFGLSVSRKMTLYLIVPILITNLVVFLAVYSASVTNTAYEHLLWRILGVVCLNSLGLIAAVLFTMLITNKPVKVLSGSLQVFADRSGRFSETIPTDLSDDFAYITYLMNRAIDSFKELLGKVVATSSLLACSVQDMSESSKNISTTSNSQAAAIKEIVSTMEDSDRLAKKIRGRIEEVASISQKTTGDVDRGVDKVKDSLDKMREIHEANGATIEGIKELSKRIESIWEIINIINNIADQTKIIAFNAELEASTAGSEGKNFKIVATEIRRLADSTTASTGEIRRKINEIQHSSDTLIITSEEGTGKIKQGSQLSEEINSFFADILKTSEVTTEASNQINVMVNQQVSAFEQTLVSLKIISDGIDRFSESVSEATRSSEELKKMAANLDEILSKYVI